MSKNQPTSYAITGLYLLPWQRGIYAEAYDGVIDLLQYANGTSITQSAWHRFILPPGAAQFTSSRVNTVHGTLFLNRLELNCGGPAAREMAALIPFTPSFVAAFTTVSGKAFITGLKAGLPLEGHSRSSISAQGYSLQAVLQNHALQAPQELMPELLTVSTRSACQLFTAYNWSTALLPLPMISNCGLNEFI